MGWAYMTELSWATSGKFDCFIKYFFWINLCFYVCSLDREPFEMDSTRRATPYLVNTVSISLGWVMSSLVSPGWETGMLQSVDWGKGLWAGCCICVFFNMWNEESMEGRLCWCLCMCTPVCLHWGLLQHCCVKTVLCTGQLWAGECVERLNIHSKLTRLKLKSTSYLEAQTHAQ